ncbi:cobalt-precorrin-6A reductase [Gordonia sp. HY285]|uniref:cobalt-precorrin-6A reductase n=1 Tax=Gordonia liuliyuniae TaxID=2911517 RepID=UPI001F007B15|nr:cobalt-precorrin-6A reductase [Gordonia liuliyuniae]MCF8610585.1 cobalt-precorrin-6A reductase [Gordonia liuliyuniae]
MPDVLVLGGTGDARAVAAALVDDGVDLVSSLAGRVQSPRLPVGEVRIGGFGGRDGLADYLRGNGVRVVVDATHPFAARITPNAVAACAAAGVAYLRVARPAWEPEPADRWTRVPDVNAAATVVAARGGRVFLTTGRQDVGAFACVDDAWFLIRVVDAPDTELPPHHELLRSRGPYTVESERELLERHAIDLLVTKNSGGPLTSAKLRAAAERGIEVVVVDRPSEPTSIETAPSADDAAARVRMLLQRYRP